MNNISKKHPYDDCFNAFTKQDVFLFYLLNFAILFWFDKKDFEGFVFGV